MAAMEPISVSTLSDHIVNLFRTDNFLADVNVLGEVSNWKRAASGHIYFSLKDDSASINAVMWRGNASTHTWLPSDGDQIIAKGYVDVYAERSVYQLYVNRIQPAGKGQLYAQFEALKRRLQAAGLFTEERKRPLPSRVNTVGVVTSANAAALRDICRVLQSRWPIVNVIVFPTLVQGAEAPTQIAAAIRQAAVYSNEVHPIDVLLVSRGGGSMEDLWAFNDEQVAYAIAECPLPIVSGVGHETDFTITDFVADMRMPTPSAAAAAVVPDKREVQARLAGSVAHSAGRLYDRINRNRQRTESHLHRLSVVNPKRMLDLRRQMLDDRERRLNVELNSKLMRTSMQTVSALQKLEALSPRRVLQRGYSIVMNKNADVIADPVMVEADDRLTVHTAAGAYGVVVESEQ